MQGILLGNPINLYDDWVEQRDACYRITRKGDVDFDGDGGSEHYPRPIFIFHFEWGMRGAATATVISQLIGMVWVVSHFVKKDSTVHFEGNIWKMKRRIVESIFAIGMSPFR